MTETTETQIREPPLHGSISEGRGSLFDKADIEEKNPAGTLIQEEEMEVGRVSEHFSVLYKYAI